MIQKIYVLLAVFLVFTLGACQNKKGPSSSFGPSQVSELKTIYFDYDRSAIRDDQVNSLNHNAQYLKGKTNLRVTVEGHCDERGTNEYNLALGDRRARSTRDYLVNLGVDPARMRTMSYGEERPVCMGHEESCWWQNRRAVFVK